MIGAGRHPLDWLSTHPAFYSTRSQAGLSFVDENLYDELSARTVVGSDVWIGARSLIMGGVEVGDGAIVAAGAVVTRSVPPYAVVRGVPATVARFRFTPEVIEELLDFRWWDLPDATLARIAPGFRTPPFSAAHLDRLRREACRR